MTKKLSLAALSAILLSIGILHYHFNYLRNEVKFRQAMAFVLSNEQEIDHNLVLNEISSEFLTSGWAILRTMEERKENTPFLVYHTKFRVYKGYSDGHVEILPVKKASSSESVRENDRLDP